MPLSSMRIVVLGGSAGAIEAINSIVKAFPAELNAAVFVVVHLNPTVPSYLPNILRRRSQMRVVQAEDRTVIEAGTIYVAPPDRHLVFDQGMLRLGRGPRENGFRPAVNPLFRSAAAHYGGSVIAAVLSGNLDDGTAGLLEVKKHGGTAIVQDPEDALHGGMPSSALHEVPNVDYVLAARTIGETIVGLIRNTRPQSIGVAVDVPPDIAIGGEEVVGQDERESGRLAGYGCPACGGTLWEIEEGQLAHYRCRVGHAFSDEALLAAQTEGLELALWTALRALDEMAEQATRISRRMSSRGLHKVADRLKQQAEDAQRRAAIVRQALVYNQASNDTIEEVG